MKNILSFIVTSLADKPDEISIQEEETDGIINFVIAVAPEDMGKIIGKEGRVIRAIRNVMKIPAMKRNVRINIALADPGRTE